jgi:hypothetical protein
LQEAADRIFQGGAALGMRPHFQDKDSDRHLVSWI